MGSFEALTAAYAEAVFARDAAKLAALYDPEVRVFDAWGRWSYEGLAAWRPNLDEWMSSLGEERVQISFEDVHASEKGDVGFFSAIVSYAAIGPGGERLRSMQNRLTWVLAWRGEAWAILHEHTSAPIDFDHQTAILTRT